MIGIAWSWRSVLEDVARQHGTTYERAVRRRGPNRTKRKAVLVAMAKALDAEGLSTTAIGRQLDRDHTTITWYLGRLGMKGGRGK